jgi:NAD(P)-dependent dehydrogenase (short-subunit alcohol dehydrogenase family)
VPSDERVAIVTGASSGIGREIALSLANDGYSVACFDVSRESHDSGETQPTDEAISEGGTRSVYVQTDVADEAEVDRGFEQTVQQLGTPHLVVNNAGIALDYAPIETMTLADFRRVIGINLLGVWLCSRAGVRAFTEARVNGSIINIASIAGLVGFPEETAYCASKGGVIALTRALALEVADRGIRVNAVCPGYVHTSHLDALSQAAEHPMAARTLEAMVESTPLGRLGETGDIASVVRFLASDQASWVTGSIVTVDGGFTSK